MDLRVYDGLTSLRWTYESTMDPSAYPPEYLAQDRSWETRNAAFASGILETLFVFLFFLSRYGKASNVLNANDVIVFLHKDEVCFAARIYFYKQ